MKTLLVIAVSVFLSVLGCTDNVEPDLYTYTVRNETGFEIKVKSYISMHPNISPIVTILSPNEESTKTYKDSPPPRGYDYGYFFATEKSRRDSLVVIFDMAKIVSFNDENCDDNRNPLNFCEYRNLEETFIFTEQDYENAEDCNGNCD